ncbi:MAG: flagellar biosynthetic protein FliR [Planctomycetota bacterium]|nr:flagellar biosynthetic protein FliR [Planctomycetota bacterium]
MPTLDAILPHVVPYVLVCARLTGLFIFAPVVAGVAIPWRVKALLIAVLGVAAYPLAHDEMLGAVRAGQAQGLALADPARLDLGQLLPMVFGESIIGLALGIVALMPLIALDMGGVFMTHSMGMSLARVYNPQADAEVDVVGQLLSMIATAAFIVSGALDALFSIVLATFERVPPGRLGPSDLPLELVVGTLHSGLELALRVAAPVIAVVFLALLVLGVLSKTMPQLQVMTVGFIAKILLGLLALVLSLPPIADAVSDECGKAMTAAAAWASQVGAEAGGVPQRGGGGG